MQENNKLHSYHPATGQWIGKVELTATSDVPDLYSKARAAFATWSGLRLPERIKYIRNIRIYMTEHLDDIATVIADDTGKVKTEAVVADLLPVVDGLCHIEKHAKHILSEQKKTTPLLFFGKKSYVEYIPRGVVLVISPWNYPLQLALIPVVSALVAGNTVILKPSEVTPLVGKQIEDIVQGAGLPPHVVQVAHGGGNLGAALTAGKPDYIFFTGSVRTGKMIQQQAAKDLIPTTLELGGKDPMIVFEDANIERAVQGALWGAFTNSGQVCMSVERLYVHRSIYDSFKEKLVAEVKKLKQGTAIDDDIGSMTYPQQVEIVKAQVEEAIREGATLEAGVVPEQWDQSSGLFIPPTVLTNVNQEMKVVKEETFGPILPMLPFDTEEESIALANDSNYGLNASVWSSDIKKAKRVASQLLSGNVLINEVIVTVANHHLPFGGIKESGLGRYHGEAGLRDFCHEKSVMVDKGSKNSELYWYPYREKYPLLKDLIYHLYSKKRNWAKFVRTYKKLLKK
ncbi:aldehyde dehydrogenase family protein [Desertibacillus haloalkaliphilus]|uniref:aldehyde dehydrogenase family protein n=1 Tax=Desertibacillus haloalkaliphilus TaxID=1328930 RepID=UPI001C27D687|nr:aldehyde dehydrogenase family protein [Desertibacillus haloalkaliphilus]MBU8908834.1 aldehyde dehydrogenase family protein [Desertibacillus haloalkaliphilus]